MMSGFRLIIAGLALALALASAGPAAAENVLRFASFSGGAVTMDPHSYVTRYNSRADA